MTAVRKRGRTANPPGGEDRESGQTIVLIIGYVVIALLAVSATLAATSVNIEARRLLSVADGAVAAAADGYSVEASGDGPVRLRLTDATVRAAATGYLSDTGAGGRFTGLGIASAGAGPDGTTAHVTLRATAHPPIVGWFVPAGIPISVDSTARTILTR